MAEKRKLSHTAYGGVKGENYIPFVSVKEALPELTVLSILMGCLFAIIFGLANTYLGLKAGMTVSAGIPAAILATGLFNLLGKKNIIEANMIQAMAAMGESLAGGLIFTIPAIIILGMDLSITTIIVVAVLGGLLGILFVVPLRKYLIVEEHGNLIYPESLATAEVLVNSSEGGKGFATMMTGVAVGGLFKLLAGGLKFWSEEPEWTIESFQSTSFGIYGYASLIGVGYIVGIEIAMYMFSGALVAWFGLIPLIKYVGAGLTVTLFPSTVLIKDMSAGLIWNRYVRYIGAGAVAAGGFISIIKTMPTIASSFKSAMSGIGAKGEKDKKTDLDVPMTWVIGGAALVFFLAWFLPWIEGNVLSAILVVIFSFFFAVVSARLVGLVGCSNNPISGMTIATLLCVTGALKVAGYIGNGGMFTAIAAGGTVCVAIAIAGGSAQSLKTTYLMGGTPKYVEIGMFIAVAVSAGAIGWLIKLLNTAYGLGGKEFGAPQASLMSVVVKGIMDSQIPWTLVIIGVAFGVMCELLKIPVLPFALGLYLPIGLSSGVLIGGIIKVLVDQKFKKDEQALKAQTEKGVLLASGMIAGEALIGILLAVFTMAEWDIAVGPELLGTNIAENPWFAGLFIFVLSAWFYMYTRKVDKKA